MLAARWMENMRWQLMQGRTEAWALGMAVFGRTVLIVAYLQVCICIDLHSMYILQPNLSQLSLT